MNFLLSNQGLSDIEIFCTIGVAIAQRKPDLLKGLDLDSESTRELQAIWRKIAPAFSLEEEAWFKAVLEGKDPINPNTNFGNNIDLPTPTPMLELNQLDGLEINIQKYIYIQNNGILAISLKDLEKAIDDTVNHRLLYYQKRFLTE